MIVLSPLRVMAQRCPRSERTIAAAPETVLPEEGWAFPLNFASTVPMVRLHVGSCLVTLIRVRARIVYLLCPFPLIFTTAGAP